MTKRLKQELRQTKPFSSLGEEVFLNLLKTADWVDRRLTEVLKPSGLSPTQYNVMRILRGAGREGMACREIGERMITRDPDITRMLDRLQKRGLIRRRRQPQDRRVILTTITPAGLELLAGLDEPLAQAQKQELAHMDAGSLKALSRLLEEARAAGK